MSSTHTSESLINIVPNIPRAYVNVTLIRRKLDLLETLQVNLDTTFSRRESFVTGMTPTRDSKRNTVICNGFKSSAYFLRFRWEVQARWNLACRSDVTFQI